MTLRDEVRQELHVYMARTGLTLVELAARTGYARQSLIQFSSGARYGDGDGSFTAQALREFMRAHPAPRPKLPGKLYVTESVRRIDELLAYTRRGRCGVVYGPAGSQKSFTCNYRTAEAYGDGSEPGLVYVYLSAALTPYALLRRIACGLGAPASQYTEGLRENILYCLRNRQTRPTIIVDEAQHLRSTLDTLEVLREIGDRGEVGILVAGHDDVFNIFAPRRGQQFEHWRSRIQQKCLRLLGPTRPEARTIVAAEIPGLKEAAVEALLNGCTVRDETTGRDYVCARRLFNSILDIQHARAERRERLN